MKQLNKPRPLRGARGRLLRGSVNPASPGRLSGPGFQMTWPRTMSGMPHMFWGPAINAGAGHWARGMLHGPKPQAEPWWRPDWLNLSARLLGRLLGGTAAGVAYLFDSTPLNEEEAKIRQQISMSGLLWMKGRLDLSHVMDYGQLEDPRYEMAPREETIIPTDDRVHREPAERSRLVMPGIEPEPVYDYLPLPEPGMWERGRLLIRERNGQPEAVLKRARDADAAVDRRQRDYKSGSIAQYTNMLRFINRTYGTAEEIQEFQVALLNNIVWAQGVRSSDLKFLTLDKSLRAVLNGDAYVDIRGLAQDLAWNQIEDMAYGFGGKVNKMVQQALRLPPGLLSAWNASVGKTHPELRFQISKEIGDHMMRVLKETNDGVPQFEVFPPRIPGSVFKGSDLPPRRLYKNRRLWPKKVFPPQRPVYRSKDLSPVWLPTRRKIY